MKKFWYIVGGVLILGIIIFKSKKDTNSNFVGVKADKWLKNTYTKAINQTGYSDLYKLKEFEAEKSGSIKDFTEISILETRILNGVKYFLIDENKWIEEENVIIP